MLGKRVELWNTTNYTGEKGVIEKIDRESNLKGTMFGYHHEIKLDMGVTVIAFKFEGIRLI